MIFHYNCMILYHDCMISYDNYMIFDKDCTIFYYDCMILYNVCLTLYNYFIIFYNDYMLLLNICILLNDGDENKLQHTGGSCDNYRGSEIVQSNFKNYILQFFVDKTKLKRIPLSLLRSICSSICFLEFTE